MRKVRVRMRTRKSRNYKKGRLVWIAQMSSASILRNITRLNQAKKLAGWFRICLSSTTLCRILNTVRMNFWTFRPKLDSKPLSLWVTYWIMRFRWIQLCGLLYLRSYSIASILIGNFSRHKIWSRGKFRFFLTSFRINVSMTNFVDMLIDYPNSKVYASDMFDKLLEMGVMTKDQNQLYK